MGAVLRVDRGFGSAGQVEKKYGRFRMALGWVGGGRRVGLRVVDMGRFLKKSVGVGFWPKKGPILPRGRSQ